jgi:hypothetical protein
MTNLILVGFGAGVVSALLFATLATGQAFAVGFFYLTPLPILFAGIAFNHLAGAIAALAAAILLGAFLGIWFLLAFLVGIGLPAYVLAYLAMLARPTADGALEWYPPGHIVVAAAALAGAATAMTVPAFGLDAESYRGALREAFERILRAQTNTPSGQPLVLPGAQDPRRLIELLTVVMPPAAAVLSMVTMLANLWIAGRITMIAERLSRPWPDLNEIRFPAATPIALAASVAGTFLPGLLGIIAGFFAATFLIAYAVLGFSAIHGASRAFPARMLVLTGIWLIVFLLGWPILLVMMIGLADTVFDFRRRFGGGGANPPPNTTANE